MNRVDSISARVHNLEYDRRCTCARVISDVSAKADAICMYCVIQPMREKAALVTRKYCPKCAQDLPRDAFNVRKRNGSNQLYSWCRDCSRTRSKAYHDQHRCPTRRTAAEYKLHREVKAQARINALARSQTKAYNPLS